MFASIRSAFRRWWDGELLLPSLEEIFEEDRPDTYRRNWSSSLARVIATFWLKHWGTLCLIIVGVATVLVTLFVHYDNKRQETPHNVKQSK